MLYRDYRLTERERGNTMKSFWKRLALRGWTKLSRLDAVPHGFTPRRHSRSPCRQAKGNCIARRSSSRSCCLLRFWVRATAATAGVCSAIECSHSNAYSTSSHRPGWIRSCHVTGKAASGAGAGEAGKRLEARPAPPSVPFVDAAPPVDMPAAVEMPADEAEATQSSCCSARALGRC